MLCLYLVIKEWLKKKRDSCFIVNNTKIAWICELKIDYKTSSFDTMLFPSKVHYKRHLILIQKSIKINWQIESLFLHKFQNCRFFSRTWNGYNIKFDGMSSCIYMEVLYENEFPITAPQTVLHCWYHIGGFYR